MAIKSSNHEEIYAAVERCAYLRIELDNITANVSSIRKIIPSHTGIIGVLKGNALGHGSVAVAKHLKSLGVERLAVATVSEGEELRQAGILGPILVFGNAHPVEAKRLFRNRLTPTVNSVQFAEVWATLMGRKQAGERNGSCPLAEDVWKGGIEIEVDTGLNRNGVQPSHLQNLMMCCDDFGIPVEGIYQHFSKTNSSGVIDYQCCQNQLNTFLHSVEKYRSRGIKVHATASGTLLHGIGIDLDYIRVGKALYGMMGTPEGTRQLIQRPCLSLIAKPTRVTEVPAGCNVGYGDFYKTKKKEVIATFSLGYGDGYGRLGVSGGWIQAMNGTYYPVVGNRCMDATTVKLDSLHQGDENYYLMSTDPDTKITFRALYEAVGSVVLDFNNTRRLPRVYVRGDDVVDIS